MKKSLALVLAAVMLLAVCGAAFAATDRADVKGTVKITGLKKDDVVNLYQVVEWNNGWQILSDYAAVSGISELNAMDATKAAAIANAAEIGDLKNTATIGDDGEYSYEAELGMYVAIIKSASDTIYNPMILSVNWNSNGTSTGVGGELNIDSTTVYAAPAGTVAKVKKSDIPLDKKVADTYASTDSDKAETVEVGDTIPFEVTTTVPAFADNWTAPMFKLTDTMTTGLELVTGSISVALTNNGTTNTYSESTSKKVTITENGVTGYTVDILEDYLKAEKPTEVKITYNAKVTAAAIRNHNVDRLNNTVELEYSHNPQDSSEHKKKDVQTNHYTFSIDADILGYDGGQNITSELVKIAVDANGDSVYAWLTSEVSSWTSKTKLAGATFTLTGANGFSQTIVTDENGYLKFEGLEEGTYTLTEDSAPAGYVKETGTHKVVIQANVKPDYTTTINGVETVVKNELESYTITVDDVNTSTYHTVNNASDSVNTTSVEATNKTTPIINTKGLELPSTGGIGTTIFYVAGLLMVLGAATILVARRKADAE